MSSIDVKNMAGETVSTAELADAIYGIEPNIPVVHKVVTVQAASRRQGTHSTKNRAAVSGGGVKPFRQKGTGRARQGTIRAPQPCTPREQEGSQARNALRPLRQAR